MEWYCAYGLSVCSAISLPELVPGVALDGDSGAVTIRFSRITSRPTTLDDLGLRFTATADEACHVVEGVGVFLVRNGREILIDPAPGAEDRLLRLSLLGPALALVLHQRGRLVIHGSVVADGDRAVAFLGRNGWGKSTIAAALYRHGYDLVTDDVAAIEMQSGRPHVVPGFPQVKLWPEAASLLGESPERLPVLHPDFDKRAWRPERAFSLESRRLERIYALTPGATPAIEMLQPREACLELLGHWYGHRFGRGLLQGGASAMLFRQCAELANQVSTRRLVRSGGSRTLLELANLVHEDLRGLGSNTR